MTQKKTKGQFAWRYEVHLEDPPAHDEERMTLLEAVGAVFAKGLDDWCGQPDEPFLDDIELPVDPTTIRQVLREAIHRTKVRAWGQIELRMNRIEIADQQLSYLTWEDCCPEETPLPVQAVRFFDKVAELVKPGDGFSELLKELRPRLVALVGDDVMKAGHLMDAARHPSRTQGIVDACDTLIEELRKTVGVDESQIDDLENIRDAVRDGEHQPPTVTQKTLFHDGAADTRSGLVACVGHAVELSKRGWGVAQIASMGTRDYNNDACEVCAVGFHTAIKMAKGYRG